MEEKKSTWRTRSVDFYRVAEAESWLSDMAEKGLVLEKAGLYLCRFEKTEPRKVRFRLEPRGKSDPDDDYVEACAEMGWELVDCWRGVFLIWKCERTEVPEFHTDPIAESYGFRRLTRSMMWSTIIALIGMAVIIATVGLSYMKDPVTRLITDDELFSMILFFSFIWADLEAMRQWLSIRRLTKKLRTGEDIHERVEVKHKGNWIPDAIYLVSALLMIMIPFYGIAQSRTGPADRFELRIPRLCEIEEGVAIKEGLTIDGVDYGNFVHTSWAVLAPEILELNEQGYVDESVWEEWHQDGRKEEEIPITYKAVYYRLRFAFLTEPLLTETANSISEELGITFEPVDGGDSALYGANEMIQHLLVRSGNEVVHMRYRGPEDLRDSMDILLKKLDG